MTGTVGSVELEESTVGSAELEEGTGLGEGSGLATDRGDFEGEKKAGGVGLDEEDPVFVRLRGLDASGSWMVSSCRGVRDDRGSLGYSSG